MPIVSISSYTLSVYPFCYGEIFETTRLVARMHSLIHIVLDRTFQVLASQIPVPSLVPAVRYTLSDYLRFDLNWAAIHAGLYFAYYLVLEPVAAVRIPRLLPPLPPYTNSI